MGKSKPEELEFPCLGFVRFYKKFHKKRPGVKHEVFLRFEENKPGAKIKSLSDDMLVYAIQKVAELYEACPETRTFSIKLKKTLPSKRDCFEMMEWLYEELGKRAKNDPST